MLKLIMIMWLLFIIKHFVVDFPMQGPFQYKNKGTYGHPGGILHAGNHAAGTLLVLALCGVSVMLAIALSVLDFVVHYHVDWAKMNINAKKGWGPTTHEQFWVLLGIDQMAHMMTYWVIILLAML